MRLMGYAVMINIFFETYNNFYRGGFSESHVLRLSVNLNLKRIQARVRA
jgi:hypothetical protein